MSICTESQPTILIQSSSKAASSSLHGYFQAKLPSLKKNSKQTEERNDDGHGNDD